MKMEFTNHPVSLTLVFFMIAAGNAQAALDLSPWKNPAGPNTGLTPDITLSSNQIQDLVPLQVDAVICNYGDQTVISTSQLPIGATLRGLGSNFTMGIGTDAIPYGVSLAPGDCSSVSFTWTPNASLFNVTTLLVSINNNAGGFDIGGGVAYDNNMANNGSTRLVSINNAPEISEYSCHGFYSPFDHDLSIKNKSKGTIPVKLELKDEYGVAMTDSDISAPPVINLTFNSTVYGDANTNDAALESVGSSNSGNQFTFNSAEQLWEYRLGTKQFQSAGTYQVTVASGDGTEYTINAGNQCAQSFTRQN